MENQNNQNPVVQSDSSSRVAELLSNHFKASSSTKTAFNFIKVLAILFVVSAIWANIAESSIQFVFVIVAALYVVFVFGQIMIKENDSRLKQTNTLAKTLQVMAIENNQIEEELDKHKEAFQKSKVVIIEWEKAHSYLKAENTNLNNNFGKLEESYLSESGRLKTIEKQIESYKSEKENFDKIVNKEKTNAYVAAIAEYDEYTTLKRSIPQLQDEDKKVFAEARKKELEARIEKAKSIYEQSIK